MKKIYLFVPIFLIALIVITAITPTIAMSESISTKVFRLHILANSDSPEDQELKLRVRDRILTVANELYSDCKSVDEAIAVSRNNIELFKETARKTIAFNGYDYDAEVMLTKEYFNTRKYDGFTLPAGIYDSLKIIIASGEGHNWWCVMFPSVCLSGCTDDFDSVLSDNEKDAITSDKYIIRFKAVELYELIKSKIIT